MRIFFLLSFLFFLSCNTSKKIKEYESFKSQIQESAFDEFPLKNKDAIEKSSFMIIHYSDAIYMNNFCGIIIGDNYSTVEFEKESNQIENDYEKIIPNNKCVKYIPNYSDNNCNEVTLPNINDSMMVSNKFLSKNVTFYRKKQMRGYFLKGENSKYYKTSKNLDHGFSSGAVVDEDNKKIVYWLLIW